MTKREQTNPMTPQEFRTASRKVAIRYNFSHWWQLQDAIENDTQMSCKDTVAKSLFKEFHGPIKDSRKKR